MGLIDNRINPGTVNGDGYLAYHYALKGFIFFSEVARVSLFDAGLNYVIDDPVGKESAPNFRLMGNTAGSGTPTKVPETAFAGPNVKFGNSTVVHYGMPFRGRPITVLKGWQTSLSDPENGMATATSGLFFAYFAGMLTPDKTSTANTFRRLFFTGLGDTAEHATIMWNRLRSGFRSLAFTTAGRALSHLYLGIELAIQSNAAITAVIEKGVYHGFVLQASNLRFTMGGMTRSAIAFGSIKESIKSLNRHAEILGKIVALLNSAIKDDGMPWYNFSLADVNTSRKLMTTWLSVNLDFYTSTTFLDELKGLFDALVFGDSFAVCSQKSLMDFLNYVYTGDGNFIQGYPAYFGGNAWKDRSRVNIGLGIFGPRVPTLSFGKPKDQIFQIPGDNNKEDTNTIVNEEKKMPLRYLPFKEEPLTLAASQWSTMFNTGKIIIPHGRKGKQEFTNTLPLIFRTNGEVPFLAMYQKVKDISIATRNDLKQGKRPREKDDVELGSSKKQKKKNDDIADFL